MLEITHETAVQRAFEGLAQQAIILAPATKESFDNIEDTAPAIEQARQMAEQIMTGKSRPYYDKDFAMDIKNKVKKQNKHPELDELYQALQNITPAKIDSIWEEAKAKTELDAKLAEHGVKIERILKFEDDVYMLGLRYSLI